MSEIATQDIKQELAALQGMSVGDLKQRYAEVFGEEARSGNRLWLLRRVAWRIQMLAEGDLAARAMEHARKRSHELARDADLRLRPAEAPIRGTVLDGTTATQTMPIARDERVPPPGTELTRTYKGREYAVTVLPNGFEHDGVVYRSLSAVAYAITGSHWNGMHFFGLTKLKRDRREEGTE